MLPLVTIQKPLYLDSPVTVKFLMSLISDTGALHNALTQLNIPSAAAHLLTVTQQIALALFLHTPYILTLAAQAAADDSTPL